VNRFDFFQIIGQLFGLDFPKLSLLVKFLIVCAHFLVLVSYCFYLLFVRGNLSPQALAFMLQELQLILSWNLNSILVLIPARLLVDHYWGTRIDAGKPCIAVRRIDARNVARVDR
jgi:hypothetical protein